MKSTLKKISGCVLAAVLFVGCASAPTTPLTQAQKVDRLATVLKISTSSAVSVAANDRKQDTRDKILLARNIINGLVANGDVTPDNIVQSLTPLLKDTKPEVRIAATTALGLLEAYFNDYVINVPGGNENAVKFLKAVVAGIDEGLATAPTVVK